MKKTLLVAVAAALGLTACASHHSHGMKSDPASPRVSILGGKQIVVDQEPLFLQRAYRTSGSIGNCRLIRNTRFQKMALWSTTRAMRLPIAVPRKMAWYFRA